MTILLALGLPAVAWAVLLISEWRTRRARPEPPLLLPGTLLDCGCLRVGAGLLLPCAVHDPVAEPPVEQWAAEMGDQQ